MKFRKIYWILFSACFLKGYNCKRIYLSPEQTNVNLNNNFTFTCTYIEYTDVTGTKWNVEGKYTPSVVRKEDGTCNGSGIFSDKSLYEVGCPTVRSFSVTILHVQLADHGIHWICFDRERESNNVTMFVKVPVEKVTLSGPRSALIKQNSKQTFTCETSVSRPQPNLSWYLHELTSDKRYRITVNSTKRIISKSIDGLVTVKSDLLFYPNRSVNAWLLFCEAWLDNETNTVPSNQFTLNIMFPPKNPPVIIGYEDDKTFKLIESEVGELSCSMSSGNPLPDLTWRCYNDNKPTVGTVYNNIVIRNVTWIGFRDQSSCSCISNHSWSGITQSTSVSIDILFPPQRPTLQINSYAVTGAINVIINKSVNIECVSKGNPLPKYFWRGPFMSNVMGKVLNVTIDDKIDRIYKCVASNVMTRANNTQKDGKNETALTIKVLYPPEKPFFKYGHVHGKIIDHDLLEVFKGDSLSIYCDAIGNPIPTISWDHEFTNESVFNIHSVTSSINKTCTAKNDMKETVGEHRVGLSKSTLNIRVFSASKIYLFYVDGKESNGAYVVNESNVISIVCTAEGYPASDIIVTNPRGKIILNSTKSNSVDIVLRNVSYMNAGVYACVGRNLYNTQNQSSKSKLTLIVRCPPRPSSGQFNKEKVISLLNDEVSLKFTAYDYLDETNKTLFTWFQHHQSIQNDGRKFKISSHGVQSKLTIRNITHEDIGQFAVHVSNSVGKYIHFYEVMIKDKPNLPLYFDIIENSITDSSVTVTWTSGFNGGDTQVFVLIYKESTEENWQNKTIEDNGMKQRNFTLKSLSRMTEYVIQIFSRNAIGDSVHSRSFHFKTKASVPEQQSGLGLTQTGIIVGVGVGTFVGTITIVVVCLLCYKCTRKSPKSCSQAKEESTINCHNSFTYENLDGTKRKGETANRGQATPIYEPLNSAVQELSTYNGTEMTAHPQNQTSEYINTNI